MADTIQKLRCGIEVLTLFAYAFLENTINQMKTVFSGKGTSGEKRLLAFAKALASLAIGGLLGFAAVFTIVGPLSMLGRMYESYNSGDGNIFTPYLLDAANFCRMKELTLGIKNHIGFMGSFRR